jgi:four helix bundle protein
MKNFKDLLVWQRSIELVVLVYAMTEKFPEKEKFGLTNQIRRAVVSVPSNISEGHMRTTNKDFRQFLSIARGSCAELETQSIIANKLGYISSDDFNILFPKIEEVAKMLSSLSAKL